MANHGDRTVLRLFSEITRLGFEITRTKKGVYKITPPPHIGGQMYVTHGTSKCLLPMKRAFRKMYGIDLDEISK